MPESEDAKKKGSSCFKIGCPFSIGIIIFVIIIIMLFAVSILSSSELAAPGGNFAKGGNPGSGSGTGTEKVDKKCCVNYVKETNHHSVNINDKEIENYCDWIQSYSNSNNINPALTAGIITQESKFNKNATSYRGAQGLMQIMPVNQPKVGVTNPFDPEQNIRGGTKFLDLIRTEIKNYNLFTDDNWIAAYNAGGPEVQRYGGIPPNSETQKYVPAVKGFMAEFAKCVEYPSSGTYNADCGAKIVAEAKTHLGKKYVWGKQGPDQFDCSGLILYVVNKVLGTGIPKPADGQADPNRYSGNLKPSIILGPIGSSLPEYAPCNSDQDKGPLTLDISKLQPGDIIFFGNKNATHGTKVTGCNGIQHVGIYGGNDTMLHASSSYGKVVETNLSTYGKQFYGAVSLCRTGTSTQISGNLQKNIEAKVKEWQNKGIGNIGISIQGTGESAQIQATNKFISASVIKVYIAITALKQVEQGKLNFLDIKNDLYNMLHSSDNNSTNRLIDKVGGFNNINTTIKDLGAFNTIIQRKMAQPNPNKENYTSPSDINSTFTMLESGTYLNSEHRNLIKQYLTNCDSDDENALAKVKGNGIVVTHKIGSLDKNTYGYWVDNDAGIIYLNNNPIFISVFSEKNNIGDYSKQDEFIADIARTTVNYFKNK